MHLHLIPGEQSANGSLAVIYFTACIDCVSCKFHDDYCNIFVNICDQMRGCIYSLIKNQIRSKVQHLSFDVFIWSPSHCEYHQAHPRVLNEGHLIIYVQIPKSCKYIGQCYKETFLLLTQLAWYIYTIVCTVHILSSYFTTSLSLICSNWQITHLQVKVTQFI